MATEAAWLNRTDSRKEEEKKKVKVCLDINRPSHGRGYGTRGLFELKIARREGERVIARVVP
jgi:hypothetical protein